MKKLLLAVLVLLGLQIQAQITCDSITTTYLSITQDTIKVETNSMNFANTPFAMHSWDLYEGGQNGVLTYSDTNVIASIPLPSPNMIDTFVLCNWSDYGAAPYSCYSCDTFAWNNGNWNLLSMMQQPYFCCDSITYWTDAGSQGFIIGLDTTNMIHNPDSITVYWGICTNGQCYAGQGMFSYFGQIMLTDTIKVCYDAYIYENGVAEVCQRCDSLFYNPMTGTWMTLVTNIQTSINEITLNKINDNKIYDMLGREVTDIKIGTIYIRNGKKFITFRQ